MLRMISQKTGTCYQRCVGFDAMNATYSVTYECDQAMGTNYHERFKKFLTYVQDNDLMIAGAMTDVKGDRSLRPGQQKDPDLFVHVVEKREDGIVIRGAKAHMTGMVNSHEMLIMPTMGMLENEAQYAVSCAIPVDAPGVTHIFGRQTNDDRKCEGTIDQGNANYGIVGGECTPDGKFSLDACRCVGACGLAPVVLVNDEVYGRLRVDDVPGILAKYETEDEGGAQK